MTWIVGYIMYFGKLLLPLLSCAFVVLPAQANEFVEKLKESASSEIEKSETEALFRHAELSQKYVAALKALEERIKASGDLDAVIRVRDEAESITKSGQVSSHTDKGITELRDKYIAARDLIVKDANAVRTKVVESLTKTIRDREATLTKAGQVDEALEIRKDGERMLLELSAGMQNEGVQFAEDSRSTDAVELKDLAKIEVPVVTPPLVEKPFSLKGRWLESMTVPPLKQRISDGIIIGERNKQQWANIIVPKGTVWSGKTNILTNWGHIIATKATFDGLSFLGDHACKSYYLNCWINDCGFNKGGWWYGGDQATKFYFENCLITNRLALAWNVVDVGFRARTCVFEKVDLPPISFRDREPANYLNHPWFRFENCRFVDCKVPSSFVLVTRNCIFQNCIFVDDSSLKEGQKPIDVVIYQGPGGRYDISRLPKNVTITRKPDTEWKGETIPTAQALRDMMAF
jgi:predicted outer membrane lipoprotein